jgi:hypothetical protein
VEESYKVLARGGARKGQCGHVEYHPGFGPVEVTWDDGTVSTYPAIDLRMIGKDAGPTAE